MGVVTTDTTYGIPEGVVYSFPVTIKPGGDWEIVKDLEISDFAREKMDATAKELIEERDVACKFLEGKL